MPKFCPKCKEQNELTAISCKCGYFFVEEIEESQSNELAQLRHLRRKRIYAMVVALLGSVALLLAFAASFGGFFRDQVEANSSDPSQGIVDKPSKDTNQELPTNPVFPENGIPYEVTKVLSGGVIVVTDVNRLEHRIILLGIRAPKLDENFGRESKESLSNAVTHKFAIIRLRNFTNAAEVIAEVMIDGSNVGLQQILKGMALLVPEQVSGLSEVEQRQYFEAATIAKVGKYGVWSGKKGVEPSIGEIADDTAPTNGSAGSPQIDVGAQVVGIKSTGDKKQRINGFKIGRSVETSDYVPIPEPYVSIPEPSASPVVSEAVKAPPNTKVGGIANEPPPIKPDKAVAAPLSGRKYIRGPFGGCYYLNSKGNKSYVDRSMCN